MSSSRLRRERRAAVALMFAIMAIPVIGLVGLAVDYGFWNQAYASMSLAASGAALNAVKITSAATLANDKNAIPEGVTAGQQWFLAQVGTASNASHINALPPTVTVTTGSTTTATVQYAGYVPSIFGHLFNIAQYPISLTAAAQVSTSPFLNVEIMLDNSSSMEIGATPGDINAMLYLTTCSVPGAWYNLTVAMNNGTQAYGLGSLAPYSPSNQYYNAYQCTNGNKYDGQNYGEDACPLATPNLPLGVTSSPLATNNLTAGPACGNLNKQVAPSPAAGGRPLAGAPCAFACHQDTNPLDPPNASTDYYGVARHTIGTGTLCSAGGTPGSCAITLRFDLVKTAVDQVITTMQTDNITAINNLNVGVFTFDNNVQQVYPAPIACGLQGSLACQAGGDWATALSLVGAPPPTPDTLDTGIKPATGINSGTNTNMPASMTNLANLYLTAAGDGSTAATPLKVLFLVTDGMVDYGSGSARYMGPIDPSLCQTFKNLGYTVYVLYTPYYPLMNSFYLGSDYSIVEGSGSGSLTYNLQACATDPQNDYIAANPSDSTSIAAALQTFLKRALTSPARFTM